MGRRKRTMLVLLCASVLAPLLLYTDRLSNLRADDPIQNNGFVEEVTNLGHKIENEKLNALPQELSSSVKEPIGIIYSENVSTSPPILAQFNDGSTTLRETQLRKSGEHKNRALSEAPEKKTPPLPDIGSVILQVTTKEENKSEVKLEPTSTKIVPGNNHPVNRNKNSGNSEILDSRVRHLKDQLIRAKVYLSLAATRTNAHFIRELRARIKDVQRALGEATKDSELPRNAYEKLKAMEQTLAKGQKIQDDCASVVKKLRAMLHSAEQQLQVHKKQALFLTQLAAKTLPKGLHCLPLKLTTEYYSLEPAKKHFPNEEKLEDPKLYHYALFSDNILATVVVVNSTVLNAKNPSNHVFHIVTDKLNYAAMKMWFLANPPGKATIEVQNIEEFTWLNVSYSPVLKQLGSRSMIDYYFRTHRANSDPNLKYRNPKYLSILNHLRFYLPEIFPKLDKVVFLDDDIVVQRDLSALWSIDLKGKVNGAVETCGESFHRFDRYLNFSNPVIAKKFDPRACGWAYGMNVFDLAEWRKQKITEVYHYWQKLNHDRQLWKLGTLPPGLITFWNNTFPLDRSWHVLGLGYDPHVNNKEIERAAVIHYNGNMKPWLEIGLRKYRGYWSKYVNYDQSFLRHCNINP
ncbi:probable galacturonosyltransferase 4 [Ananas comosus]|uniref:Hexosyltransferase n=2 Tax=Ananas comosus TaxID=4615 RepID=A0A6P5GWA5_ANACO|nr:probable galacturonosyltransferase 4 [Ananas comosus]